ncbi:hypothetical protein [Paenibacillus faecis]|uniref:hypothetical protein n=1 Tax=Paenibacillus faecis TaxID=862114 RepID=UPI00147880EA|nr:hypothetical protein [Paenibacillus faecis]
MVSKQKIATETSNVIDYRDLYDRLKEISAAKWTREMEMFSKLYCWKLNDRRESDQNHG